MIDQYSPILWLVVVAVLLLVVLSRARTRQYRLELPRTRGTLSEQQYPLSTDSLETERTRLGNAPLAVRPERRDEASDVVDCSIFAPPTVASGKQCLVQVFLHLPESQALIANTARQIDDGASLRAWSTLVCEMARGARVTLLFRSDRLRADVDEQVVVWRGRPISATFQVSAPESPTDQDLFASVVVLVDAKPAGRLSFVTRATASHKGEKLALSRMPARRFGLVFMSYSSKDRNRVLDYARFLGALEQPYFMDVLRLRSGERFAPELFRKIEQADLFMLFWSHDARESDWVRKEAEHALALLDRAERPDFITYPIDGPPIPELWDILRDRHVGDPIYHLRGDYSISRASGPTST